jgi:hypothetical protein
MEEVKGMVYDPRRRALQLRQRIIESMTAKELEEYAKERALRDREPVAIRQCDICGENRILSTEQSTNGGVVECSCGRSRLDIADLRALINYWRRV